MQSNKVHRLVYISVFSSISIIVAKLFKVPLFPSAPFLKMDLGEVPLMIAALLFPPYGGIIAVLLRELLAFTVFGNNIFAVISNIVACGSYIFMFSLLQMRKVDKSILVTSVGIASCFRSVVAIPLNLIVLRLEFGMNAAAVTAILPYIVCFNFLKGVIDGVVAIPITSRLFLHSRVFSLR